ncbi:MAG: AarF/ABC1/UbiB kinase family protein, partial [Verrucomicrobiota bacterium]
DAATDLVIRFSQTREDFNQTEFRHRIDQLMASRQDQGLQQINVGRAVLEISMNAAENGLFVPSELTLLGKTMLQLDEVGKILDPAFDPNACVRRHASALMSKRLLKNATQGSFFSSMLEMKHFVGGLPARLNHIMDVITNHELEVKIKAVDAKLVVEGFEKIANRITTGIILAALIMGASLLMQVPSNFRILGYPGLGILCFLAAAAGGFYLVFRIFIQDHQDRKK